MPVAELGGEQHQQRPEPLAAGLDEVRAGLGDERVVVVDPAPRCSASTAASPSAARRQAAEAPGSSSTDGVPR